MHSAAPDKRVCKRPPHILPGNEFVAGFRQTRPLTASLGGLAVRTRTRLRMMFFPNAKQNEVENGCAHKRLDAAARHHPIIDFQHEDRASQAAYAGHCSKKSHARDSCIARKCRRQEFAPRAWLSPARLKGRLITNARPRARGAC